MTIASAGMYHVALDSLMTAFRTRKHSVLHTLETFFIPVGKFVLYAFILLSYSKIAVQTPGYLIFALGLCFSSFVSRLIVATVTHERY